MITIKLPDFSDHPSPPVLANEDYANWILNEWIPICASRGEMTQERLLAAFLENEGRMGQFKM